MSDYTKEWKGSATYLRMTKSSSSIDYSKYLNDKNIFKNKNLGKLEM